jgi:MFS family permease
MFEVLRDSRLRIWTSGATAANVALWLQATAMAWLMLRDLTAGSLFQVGIVIALQFAPSVLLMQLIGRALTRWPPRNVILVAQGIAAVSSAVFAIVIATGFASLPITYAYAAITGVAASFDKPCRLAFTKELAPSGLFASAIGLLSVTFNLGRLTGPLVAGALLALTGAPVVFVVCGVLYSALFVSVLYLRPNTPRTPPIVVPAGQRQGGGLGYVSSHRPVLLVVLTALGVAIACGTGGVYVAAMSDEFGADALQFGAISATLAGGAVIGSLVSTARNSSSVETLLAGVGILVLTLALAALSPNLLIFGAAAAVLGFATVTCVNVNNTMIQIIVEPGYQGRVLAVYVGASVGGNGISAPMMGFFADVVGAHWTLAIGAGIALVTLAVLFAGRALLTPPDALQRATG